MFEIKDLTHQQEDLKSIPKKFLTSLEFNQFQIQKGNKVVCLGLYHNQQLLDFIHVILYPVKKIFKIGVIHHIPTSFIQNLDVIHQQIKNQLKKYKIIHLYLTTQEYELIYDVQNEEKIINPTFTSINQILQKNSFIKTPFKHGSMNYLWQYRKFVEEFNTEKELLSSYSSSHRNKISKAKKMGCNIIELSYDQLDRFKQLYNESAQKHNFTQFNLDYFQNLYKAFQSSNKLSVVMCEMEIKTCLNYLHDLKVKTEKDILKNSNMIEQVESLKVELEKIQERIDHLSELSKNQTTIDISGGIFVQEENEYIYFLGGNNMEFSHYFGSHLLQHTMMNRTMELGLPYYNFYGTIGPYCELPNQNYGVYNFKKLFKGTPIKYPHYSYSLNTFLSKICKL